MPVNDSVKALLPAEPDRGPGHLADGYPQGQRANLDDEEVGPGLARSLGPCIWFGALFWLAVLMLLR